jgi:hypothetical protein
VKHSQLVSCAIRRVWQYELVMSASDIQFSLTRVASIKMRRAEPNSHPSTLTRARVLAALAKAQAARLTQ